MRMDEASLGPGEASSPPRAPGRPDTALSERPLSKPDFGWVQHEGLIWETDFKKLKKPVRNPRLPNLISKESIIAVPGWKLAAERVRRSTPARRLVFGVAKVPPPPVKKWCRNHTALPKVNEEHPMGTRHYFSVPEREDKLRETLTNFKHGRDTSSTLVGPPAWRLGTRDLLAALRQPELKRGSRGHPLTTSVLSTDADVGSLPNRHKLDGTMFDRDDMRCSWNNRSNSGLINYGHVVHSSHREYFNKSSSLGHLKSQTWRRENDCELDPGVWRSLKTKKPSSLGPLGSLEKVFSTTF